MRWLVLCIVKVSMKKIVLWKNGRWLDNQVRNQSSNEEGNFKFEETWFFHRHHHCIPIVLRKGLTFWHKMTIVHLKASLETNIHPILASNDSNHSKFPFWNKIFPIDRMLKIHGWTKEMANSKHSNLPVVFKQFNWTFLLSNIFTH